MIIHSEQDMISFGEQIAEGLVLPATIELVGDIGVGKTTLAKGIAKGLGIVDEVTSPSFTISKIYRSKSKSQPTILTHFDFYRLDEPGILQEELGESIQNPDTVTIIEWGSTVKNILPKHRIEISISQNDDGSRIVKVKS